MAPHSDQKTVWTNFEDNSGWGNAYLSTPVGVLEPIVTLIGSRSSYHLAEELRDAAWAPTTAMGHPWFLVDLLADLEKTLLYWAG